jgi:LAO/AO transport system kinase
LDSNSPSSPAVRELSAAIRAGSARALSRGLSWIEAGGDRAEVLVEMLYAGSPWAHIVGVTGMAGAGKSTLVAAVAKEARRRGFSVGVLAVDPSSPFTGGAILGDRVRMSDLSNDAGVFIRSMAARGELGGLCKAAAAGIDLMRAAGKQLVLVETVGVGQDEVDIMRVAHTTVVVSVPGMGDDVQMLKAGLFEIADIHVVNKADREGAGETVAQIRAMLALNMTYKAQWQPPVLETVAPRVLETVAPRNEGVAALLDATISHVAHLRDSGELPRRERRMAEWRVLKLAQSMVAETLRRPGAASGALDMDFDRVARRDLSPYVCAKKLLDRATAGS